MSVENEYKEALKRLQKQGKRISNDSVAKEAGRKPTAITKRRFPELVALIAEAAEEQKKLFSHLRGGQREENQGRLQRESEADPETTS